MAASMGQDVAALLSTLLTAQAEAQLAQTNANHTNFITFQTTTAQALAAKSCDRDSKLMAAKQQILQACAGMPYEDAFMPEAVYRDMDAEGGNVDAVARILWKWLKPIPLSLHKTNIHGTPQLVATIKSLNFASNGETPVQYAQRASPSLLCHSAQPKVINKDVAKDKYFEVATLKLVVDIRKHVTGAKVKLPTSLRAGDKCGLSSITATY
jgi:hypothetical protein